MSKVQKSDTDKSKSNKRQQDNTIKKDNLVIYTNSNEKVMTNLYSTHDPLGKDLSLDTIKPQPTKEV
jgi:hypothetical protein